MRLSLHAAIAGVAGLALLAPATSAADFDASYLGLRGSYVATESASATGSVGFDIDEDYASDSFAVSAYYGRVLDEDFRLELEGGYRSVDLDEVTILRDAAPVVYLPGDIVNVSGDAQVGTLMVNLYYDIHIADGPILPWIGAGFGGAFVDYSIEDPNAVATFDASDTAWVFAFQLMAGITFPVADGISMSAGYRFFQTQDFAFVSTAGEDFETDLTQHSFDLGLQFHL